MLDTRPRFEIEKCGKRTTGSYEAKSKVARGFDVWTAGMKNTLDVAAT
jgi:hypothetical protein